jgi:hypothetical protein
MRGRATCAQRCPWPGGREQLSQVAPVRRCQTRDEVYCNGRHRALKTLKGLDGAADALGGRLLSPPPARAHTPRVHRESAACGVQRALPHRAASSALVTRRNRI